MATEKFKLSYSKRAETDLDSLRTYDQRLILDAIERYLESEPTKESKTRIKKMTQPFWSEYRLRVGEYRVYYDVDEEKREVSVVKVYEKGQAETPKDKPDEAD